MLFICRGELLRLFNLTFGEMYKNPWQEWQLYVFGLIYLTVFSIVSVLVYKDPVSMRLLDFLLAYFLYERIWHLNKEITFKKVLKTFLWAAIGNIAILLVGIVIALLYGLLV